MVNGKLERTEQGTTQGSPLSPLLSNIVLDELDKELERRGLEFCRFADDCNIFFGSNKAAERAITISTQAMSKAIEKVKELTPRSTHKTIERAVQEISSWYRGWSSYFSMTQYPSQLKNIEAHIRRRLRARFIRNMKRKRTIVERLIKKGVLKQNASKTVYSPKSWWALSNSGAANKAFSNKWFETNGLFTRSQEQQPHRFSVEQWIRSS